MKRLTPNIMSALVLAFVFPVLAKDAAPTDEAVERRFHEISSELRCMVCQNESLAISSAGLAADLRSRIRAMILEGKSDDEIMDFMTARYGDFIRYRPRLKRDTVLLWFGPGLLLIGAFGAFLLKLKGGAQSTPESAFDASEQARAEALLHTNISGLP
ncbi:MAG: cytochrome c-type biogenesis protein CcmH [Candidatus Accumulibacter sp.]|jgi:cytochrome c-type biogenesis protein CcmH|nr:cytochrome c-type biogenesis protein CcmH [Accumulibacter sp.]